MSQMQIVIDGDNQKIAKLTVDLENEKNTNKNNDELNKSNNQSSLREIKELLKKKSDDYEILKQMVVDKDKQIKKLEEIHKKEVSTLKISKTESDDALNRVTAENTKLKDKDNTLMEIFKLLKENIGHAIDVKKSSNENLTCDNCQMICTSSLELKDHKDNQHKEVISEVQTDQVISCDECEYTNTSEDNVLNHKIAQHQKHFCNKCGFVTESLSDLMSHLNDNHTNTSSQTSQFTCRKCTQTFATRANLNTHLNTHKVPNFCICDYCGFKAETIEALDIHIQSYHKIVRNKNINRVTNTNSASAQRNSHTVNTVSAQERLENGLCRRWIEGNCRFNQNCRYTHIKICKFQERCRSPFDCQFYHYNQSNAHFLLQFQTQQRIYPRVQQVPVTNQTFYMRSQDFPPLYRRGQGRQ